MFSNDLLEVNLDIIHILGGLKNTMLTSFEQLRVQVVGVYIYCCWESKLIATFTSGEKKIVGMSLWRWLFPQENQLSLQFNIFLKFTRLWNQFRLETPPAKYKHRKNCECCLIINHYSSMSWFKFRNLFVIVIVIIVIIH